VAESWARVRWFRAVTDRCKSVTSCRNCAHRNSTSLSFSIRSINKTYPVVRLGMSELCERKRTELEIVEDQFQFSQLTGRALRQLFLLVERDLHHRTEMK